MSIAVVSTFMAWITAFVAIAGIVLVGSLVAGAVSFFLEHRSERVAAQQPVGSYYRQLAFGH